MTATLPALATLGQSIWLDYLQRDMLQNGELKRMIAAGLRGLTSNPTIFEHAIAASDAYDEDILRLARESLSDAEIFERLAVDDVQHAADLFRAVYEETHGLDGYVSLEVSPNLARDTAGALQEARRLWKAVDRPNLMIKVPGTREGLPVIEQLLAEGINVNVTLLFSVDRYQEVADAYMRALETRLAQQRPLQRVCSVASLFISRIDSVVDAHLERTGDTRLRGHAAIANARLAYGRFQELITSARWRRLHAYGAMPQRLLWASTSTKNPDASELVYVNALVGADTVNTLPPDTLAKLQAAELPTPTFMEPAAIAQEIVHAITQTGIDWDALAQQLEQQGIDKFKQSYDRVLNAIAERRRHIESKTAQR